jgi:hypothetical protein
MDDRRGFIKGMIAAGAAVTAVEAATASTAGAAEVTAGPKTPGRKLPFASGTGVGDTLAFGTDLAAIAAVPPAQWDLARTKMEEYLGPLVDSGHFLASSYSITIEGCITITGSAA